MDPNHRDRIAFVRLCSGHFRRGMKLFHVRSEKQIAVNNAVLFLARERELAEDAYAGDIMGIPNHGTLRIGDTLTEGEKILALCRCAQLRARTFLRVHVTDPLKAKHIRRALGTLCRGRRIAGLQAADGLRMDRWRRGSTAVRSAGSPYRG